MQEFTPFAPCASSELVHFRKRIGKEGIELNAKKNLIIYGKAEQKGTVSELLGSALSDTIKYFFSCFIVNKTSR